MFGLEALGDVVSPEDRAEAMRRKEQLSAEFKTALGTLFGPLREKAAALGQEQQQHMERLSAKKRKSNASGDEGAPGGVAVLPETTPGMEAPK
eukprot:84262-Pyramimonas_sp.AAC.1